MWRQGVGGENPVARPQGFNFIASTKDSRAHADINAGS